MKFLRFSMLVSVIALAGCPDTQDVTTVECDAGYAFDDPPVTDGGTPVCSKCRAGYDREDLADGGFVCTLPTDSGQDAGDAGDAGDTGVDADSGTDAGDTGVDAGPCGMECTGTTPMCDPTAGRCVACLLDEHCGDALEAKCGADGLCTACDDSVQCGGITGTEVCAGSGDNAGQCVECAAGEVGACGGNPCNPVTNACSAYGDGAVGTCEACDSDANCADTDERCIALEFMTAPRGGYCLRLMSAGCARPYGVELMAASESGDPSTSYCGINTDLTTCEAVRALVDGGECPSMMATECMADSARCETVSGLAAQCTYSCENAPQCPSGLGCGAGYCGS